MFRTIVNNLESIDYDIDDSRRRLNKKLDFRIQDDRDSRERMLFGKDQIKDVLRQVMSDKKRATLKQGSIDISSSLYGGSSKMISHH